MFKELGYIATRVTIFKSGLCLTFYLIRGYKTITKKRGNDDLVNESIRFREVMVIGPDGSQLGVMSRNEALQIAYDADLDLYCVAPNAQPPVCKILDYGRFRFDAQKKAKEAKKKQSNTEIKPLRLSPVIDTHDFETKQKQARKWLESGMKVKIDMRFRGRMMTRQEVGLKIMNEFVESLAEISSVDKQPKLEGNIMSCVLTPKKK
ncbi:MAG: translation initiation factor IF-3 [Erysipelotrichaceae bacterium]|nr:translation initiation factor IF-3 [Erysipelotrichaceae bacterium]